VKPSSPTAGPEEVTSEADKYGREGWELAAADGTIWCFKRPVDPVRLP
jgi:hypothetical protein